MKLSIINRIKFWYLRNDYPCKDEIAECILQTDINKWSISILQTCELYLHDDIDIDDIAFMLDVTRERIRQIEAQALSRLRNPSIRRQLRGFLENET